MRKIFILFCLFIIFVGFVSAQALPSDPRALVNASLNAKEFQGYFLRVNANRRTPFIYFSDLINKKKTHATYNWALQYWVSFDSSFDPSLIRLEALFTRVDLSLTVLNRDRAGRSLGSPSPSPGNEASPSPTPSPSSSGFQGPAGIYDPNAILKTGLKGSLLFGYRIDMPYTADAEFIFFRDKDNVSFNYATYNWKYQHWVYTMVGFNPRGVDLSALYASLSIDPALLQRDARGKPVPLEESSTPLPTLSPSPSPTVTVSPTATTTFTPTPQVTVTPTFIPSPSSTPGPTPSPTPAPSSSASPRVWPIPTVIPGPRPSFSPLPPALDALILEPRMELNGTIRDGMRIEVNRDVRAIIFNDIQYPDHYLALYRYNTKAWAEEMDAAFEKSRIDLTQYFKNLSADQAAALNRYNPNNSYVIRTQVWTAPYDYSNDPDYQEFMNWLVARGSTSLYVDFWRKAGQDASIRGRMQTYFNARKGKHYWVNLRNRKIISAGPEIKLTIIELEPSSGASGQRVSLIGEAFRLKMEESGLRFLKKPTRVTVKSAVIDYMRLANPPGDVYARQRRDDYLAETVDQLVPADSLVFYRLMDIELTKQIPGFYLGYPLGKGSPMQGTEAWDIGSPFHEIGHTLGFDHHYPPEVFGVPLADINWHTSPACVMNYDFKTDEYCPLCLYALGYD